LKINLLHKKEESSMKTSPFVLAASLFLLLTLGACATTNDFVRSGNEGTSRVYPVTAEQAWKIAKTVFRWEGADKVKENHNKDYIFASIGTGAFSYDAAMCAWIDPMDSEDTMVTVATKHKDLTKATTFTESTFYWRFSQAVDIVSAGKPLPAAPPD
jgi:hypothetical protein